MKVTTLTNYGLWAHLLSSLLDSLCQHAPWCSQPSPCSHRQAVLLHWSTGTEPCSFGGLAGHMPFPNNMVAGTGQTKQWPWVEEWSNPEAEPLEKLLTIEDYLTTTLVYTRSRAVPPRNKEGRQRWSLFLIMVGSEGLTAFIRFAFP